MIELREAIVDLMQESAKSRNKAEVRARGKYAAIRAGDVSEAAKALDMQLREAGYDLNKMEAAGQILQDLIDLPSQNPLMRGQRRFEGDEVARAAETSNLILPERLRREAQAQVAKSKEEVLAGLNEMWAIRNRAEKSMRPEKAFEGLNPGQNQNDVLRVIQQTIDDVIDNQFARDMMDGDPEAVAAWQAAHDIRKDFNRKFNEDKFINKMVNELDASPEQLRNALFGKSLTGPKDQAVATLRRMKRLLGDEHSAIKGITMDFVHELVQPLTADVPNFHQFIRQYDKLVRDNVTLVKEIGLDTTGLKELRDFAQMATRLPPGRQALMTPEFMATVISRYAFGHGIAKAGMTVSLWRRGISAMLGKDSISQRAILEELANTKFGEPAVQHGSIWRSRVAQAAILADWTETYLDAEDKVKEMKSRR